ncbi:MULTISPECIES: DUF485 domain-containing protein [Streptomyces]|uniref:DUF485 domain-containing protein n=1 Tax=Streptomyces griseorubiginosus TaxID=67304 RepID=A0A101RSI9_9ACTN|nr:DUF485 domain-containing protein [Streptomyces griseorubiginosus]AYC43924.1 hypothetical protein DWG14_08232 [Streptomyces griseorubiginosus]KUN60933.1 hypothetical protein AQJ54_34660 [Streptomyces griseorubiginosus]
MSYDRSELALPHRHDGRVPSPTALRPPSSPAVAARPGSGARPRSWSSYHRALRVLRRACRWQRRVATLVALGYFAVFLTLTVKAPALMSRPAPGGLPTGLLLAVAQIPVTWLAVLLFEYSARRFVDPLARRVSRYGRPADGDGRPRT